MSTENTRIEFRENLPLLHQVTIVQRITRRVDSKGSNASTDLKAQRELFKGFDDPR